MGEALFLAGYESPHRLEGRKAVKTRRTKGIITLLLALAFLLCATDLLRAQRREREPQGAGPGASPEPIVPMEYDSGPFDVTVERLPRAYGGHNIQRVYHSVKDGMPKTAREHGAGQEGRTDPLERSQETNAVYAFQVRPMEITYDKHEGKMEISCQLWSVLAQGAANPAKRGFRIAYIPRVDHTYTYTGADGKNVEVEEVKFTEYTVAFANLDAFPLDVRPEKTKGPPVRNPDASVKSGTIVARAPAEKREVGELERNLRLLAVGRLTEPYATSETVEVKGTPESPGEYLARHEYLHVRLLGLWLYDAYTGKVFAKIEPSR